MFGAGGSGFGGFGQQNQQQQNQQGAQPGQTGGLFGAPQQPQQQQQQQQPTAGSGFGGFGAQPSTFGGGNTGGSLFGQPAQQQQQQPTSGFTFGQNTSNAASTPFGQQNQPRPAGFGGFGASTSTTPATSTGFGGFGAPQNSQPQQPAASPFGGGSTFGAKPAGSMFGQPQTTTFGQPAQTGGLFGGAGGLGASQMAPMPTQGTSNPPYELKPQPEGPPDTPYDADKKMPQLLNYTSITCMKPYRGASLEELRLQDYEQGRKSGNGAAGFGQAAGAGGFGAPSQPAGLFGQQQQQPQQSNAFGGGGGLFGQSTQQPPQQPGQTAGAGLFGTASNTGGGLFGQQQQQQQQPGGLFGQTQNNQQQPASGGFGFGAPQQQQTNNAGGFTFGQNNAQQQNKPAGGLFGGGGFGANNQAGGASGGGFSFGASSQPQQQPATSGFGGTSGGFGFGSTTTTANQPKPGGLFGAPAASSAPTFGGFGATSAAPADNKPAFSFGGGGFGSSGPGQTSTAAPVGGLFGSTQPTTTSQPTGGFTFGGASSGTTAGTGGGLFGGQQTQQGTGGFGAASGGLFGNKPATGGLFGAPQQQQQQQPSTGGFGFGAPNNTAGNTAGGLFGGNNQNKPAGSLFGGLGSGQQSSGGGLFGGGGQNNNTLGTAAGGGLFGSSQPGQLGGGGGLFGSTNQQASNTGASGGLFGSSTGGFGLGGQSTGQQGLSGSLFGSTAQNQQVANLQPSLNSNPYGTDALFGGQASSAPGSGALGASVNNGLHSQPHLPFNVSLSRSSAKKQPPLVPPFRPSSRNSIRITKLRGNTPGGGLRESTPGREGTPGPVGGNSLFSSPTSSYQRLASPSPGIFRGLSDEMPRNQRESSVPATLPPQAFVSRPSVKRLVLDDNRSSTTGLGRSSSLFTSRAGSVAREDSSSVTPFGRDGTPARTQVNFSPALETAASSRVSNGVGFNEADSTFNSTSFSPQRGVEETPSKGTLGADTSLPALNRSKGKQVKEDALLPLDYWTTPALSELRDWSHSELQAVEGFVVGRRGFGSVTFDAPVDLTTVGELSNIPGGIVILRTKECIVYPDEDECVDEDTGKERDGVQPGFEVKRIPGGKAEQGSGLNVAAIVKLDKCWPYDRSTRLPIKDEEHIRFKQLINKLKRRPDAHFLSFEASTGTWIFRVDHFSRYGLDETDEEATDEDLPGKKTSRKDGKSQRDEDGSSDDDEIPPPARPLDGNTDEEQSGAESDLSDMRASELDTVIHTPRRQDRESTPRASAFLARGSRPSSVAGSVATSTQPWAASLGLEARRVQVMQASFFGNVDEEPTSVAKLPARVVAPKQTRLASPSFVSSGVGAVASRTSFLNPSSAWPDEEAGTAGAAATAMARAASLETFGSATALAGVGAPPVRPRKFSRLELKSSVVEGADGVVIDAGLSMGRSFRVGWGPGGTFVHSGRLSGTSSDQSADSVSTVKLAQLAIFPSNEERTQRARVEALLDVQLKHSVIDDDEDGDCPVVYPAPGLRFSHFVGALEGNEDSHYLTAVFKLGVALFDEVDLKLDGGAEQVSDLVDEVITLRRRNNVANWIRWYVGDTIRDEVRSHMASTGKNAGERSIFSYLSGGYFEEACKQAIDSGDVRLATLIAQASSGGEEDEFRLDLLDQLSVWRSSGVDVLISTEYRRIFELLSGNVTWSRGNGKREESEAVRDLSIVGGLDWVRTFALYLHYDAHFDSSLAETLERYEANIGGEADVVPPLPPYLEREIRPGSQRFRQAVRSGSYPRDMLFHLLKLFCSPSHELENAAQPLSVGSNELDFSTSFHVAQLLSSVLLVQAGNGSGRDFGDRIDLGVDNHDLAEEANLKGNSGRSDRLCVDYAMQLEAMGLWRWAAFVLLHLELKSSRKDCVQALLARKVDELALQDEAGDAGDVAFLVDTLGIPIQWLYQAKADRACGQEDRHGEYKYLLLARHYSRAHEVAIRFLAPEGIIRHDFDFILALFAPFQRRAGALDDGASSGTGAEAVQEAVSQEVAGWSGGGQIYLDYIAICRTLPWLVSNFGKSSVTSLSRLGNSMEPTAARIVGMANKIPKLMHDVRELFDGFQETVSMLVARTQMVTSLYTCIRLLKSSTLINQLANDLRLDVEDEEADDGQLAKRVPVEIENLQFFANDYCSLLIGAA